LPLEAYFLLWLEPVNFETILFLKTWLFGTGCFLVILCFKIKVQLFYEGFIGFFDRFALLLYARLVWFIVCFSICANSVPLASNRSTVISITTLIDKFHLNFCIIRFHQIFSRSCIIWSFFKRRSVRQLWTWIWRTDRDIRRVHEDIIILFWCAAVFRILRFDWFTERD